jgi:hypothetical protein
MELASASHRSFLLLYGTSKEKMKPTTLYTLYADPFRIWSSFAWKTSEMILASVHVIGHRSNQMRAFGSLQCTTDRRELALMGQEKIDATVESAQAMALSSMFLAQQLGAIAVKKMLTGMGAIISLTASRTPRQSAARQLKLVHDMTTLSAAATSQLSKSAAGIAHRGLKPIHSRATANARRLPKTKRR